MIIDGKRNDIGSTAEAYARGYLGKVAIGGAFEPVLAGRRPDRQPLPRQRRRPAVRQGRRPGTERGLRPRPHQQFVRRRVSGPGRRRKARLPARRRSPFAMGRARIAASAAIASSGQSSARLTRNNSPSCARHFPACLCSFPATAARVPRHATSPGHSIPRDSARSSTTRAGSPSPTSDQLTTPASATTGRPPSAQAVRDMIDDLAANTTCRPASRTSHGRLLERTTNQAAARVQLRQRIPTDRPRSHLGQAGPA